MSWKTAEIEIMSEEVQVVTGGKAIQSLVHTPWCMVMNCSMAMSQTLSLGAATQD